MITHMSFKKYLGFIALMIFTYESVAPILEQTTIYSQNANY